MHFLLIRLIVCVCMHAFMFRPIWSFNFFIEPSKEEYIEHTCTEYIIFNNIVSV